MYARAIKNSEECFEKQTENGLLISSFFLDRRDKELARIVPFLTWMSKVDDVRPVDAWYEQFRLEDQVEYIEMISQQQKVLNKHEHLANQIQDLYLRYYRPRYIKRLSSKVSLELSSKINLEPEELDPTVEMLLNDEFYLGLVDEPVADSTMEDILSDNLNSKL